MQAARQKTLLVGLTSVLAVLLLIAILLVWLVRPWGLIADYLRFARAQRSFSFSRLSKRAWGTLGTAYAELRDAISGRNYVSDYVQTLTHELKSPLSAIRGAAELLHEPMGESDRKKFLDNIERETLRIQELVDRMMELSQLESKRALEKPIQFSLRGLLEEVYAGASISAAARQVEVELLAGDDAMVLADLFLIRRAIGNLVDNAMDFSPAGGLVSIALKLHHQTVDVIVQDQGPGIPDYAGDKVFEKFYSLARPGTQRKSTGLGLPFVKEIAALHDGTASLKNAPEGGAIAVLTLLRSDP